MSFYLVTWENLKEINATKKLPYQYIEFSNKYEIWIGELEDTYRTIIWLDDSRSGVSSSNGADRTDWETNFKPTARGKKFSYISNAAGSIIDPATQETLEILLTEAQFDAVAGEVRDIPTDYTVLWRLKEIFNQLEILNNQQPGGGNLADKGRIFSAATPILNQTPSGEEHPIALIRNPSASGRTVKIRNIVTSLIPSSSQTKPTTFRIYLHPTITANGTLVDVLNKRSGSIITAVGQSYYTPTISASGDLIKAVIVLGGSCRLEEDLTLILDEGHDMLITVTPKFNNTEVEITVDWAEVDV